jgi:hypothetical protein
MLVGRKPLTVTVAPDITKRPELPVIPLAANDGKHLTRSMQQLYPDSVERPILEFRFPMGISSFQHEAPSVAYEELTRPLALPLLDTSGAQLHKVSIEFMIVKPLDGVQTPIEEQIATLRDMAASDTPVIFANVHDALKGSWKISALSFSISRTDELGRAVNANASMSLTESTDRLERFLLLPKFTYKVPRGSSTTTTGGPSGNQDSAESVYAAFRTKIGGAFSESIKKELAILAQREGATNITNIIRGSSIRSERALLSYILTALKQTTRS